MATRWSSSRSLTSSSKDVSLEETSEQLQQKLTELRAELSTTPAHQRSGDHPSFMSPEFLTHFLRTEQLHVGNAANRYRRYWEMRVKLFGNDAGKPLSAERERAALDLGFPMIVQVRELQALVAPKPPQGVLVRGHAGLVINKLFLQGGRDKEGRQIILTDPGRLNAQVAGPVELCRAFWYVYLLTTYWSESTLSS